MAGGTGKNGTGTEPARPARPNYSEWYLTPQGSVALAAQQALLRGLIACWPRRGHRLLQIGCGAGIFLEILWEAGFDVSGQEPDQELARRAASRLGRRAEISLGSQEHLPFDDQSFDYVVCLNNLEFAADPWAVLREALRLASRGLLLSFPNAASLRGFGGLFRRGSAGDQGSGPAGLGRGKVLAPWKVWNFIRKEGPPSRLTWGSTLLGPAFSWRDNALGRKLNCASLPLPLGACAMLRLDLHPACAGTPLLLNGKKKAGANTALANKSLLTRSGRASGPRRDAAR